MKLREVTEDFLEKIGGMSSVDEVINCVLSTKLQVAESLNKSGYDFDVNLDNIFNKPRMLIGNNDINNYHFLVDLEIITHVLQDRWLTSFSDKDYSDELQKRVEGIVRNIRN